MTSPGSSFAVDSQDNAYVTGFTSGNFPTTQGVYQTTFGGYYDGFILKLGPFETTTTTATSSTLTQTQLEKAIECVNIFGQNIVVNTGNFLQGPAFLSLPQIA